MKKVPIGSTQQQQSLQMGAQTVHRPIQTKKQSHKVQGRVIDLAHLTKVSSSASLAVPSTDKDNGASSLKFARALNDQARMKVTTPQATNVNRGGEGLLQSTTKQSTEQNPSVDRQSLPRSFVISRKLKHSSSKVSQGEMNGEVNRRSELVLDVVVSRPPQAKKETIDISPSKQKILKHIQLDRLLNQDDDLIPVMPLQEESKLAQYQVNSQIKSNASKGAYPKKQQNSTKVSKFNYSELVPSQNLFINIAEPVQSQKEVNDLKDIFYSTQKKSKVVKQEQKKSAVGASSQKQQSTIVLPAYFSQASEAILQSLKSQTQLISNQQNNIKKSTQKERRIQERQILQDYQIKTNYQIATEQTRLKAQDSIVNAPNNQAIASAYQTNQHKIRFDQTLNFSGHRKTKQRSDSNTESTSPTIQRLPLSRISDSGTITHQKGGLFSMNSTQKIVNFQAKSDQTDSHPNPSSIELELLQSQPLSRKRKDRLEQKKNLLPPAYFPIQVNSKSNSSLQTPKATQFLPKPTSAVQSILIPYSSMNALGNEQTAKAKYSRSFNVPDTQAPESTQNQPVKKFFIKLPNKIPRSQSSQINPAPSDEQKVIEKATAINPLKRKELIIQRIKNYSEQNLSQLGTQSERLVFSATRKLNLKINQSKEEQKQDLPPIQRSISSNSSINQRENQAALLESENQILGKRTNSAGAMFHARKFVKNTVLSSNQQNSEDGSTQNSFINSVKKLKIVRRLQPGQKNKIESSPKKIIAQKLQLELGKSPKQEHSFQITAKSQYVQKQFNQLLQGPGSLINTSNRVSIGDSGVDSSSQQIKPSPGVAPPKQIRHQEVLSLTKSKLHSDLVSKPVVSPQKTLPKNTKSLNVIEERLDTQTSAATDQNLSPRTRILQKLQKNIRSSFSKYGQPPETQCENYKIGKVMGKGAFGKVNLAIHRFSGKFVALKSINKQFMTEETSKRKVMQEFNILRLTSHENVVRLYESFETPQHIVFVMEVCGGGDLLTYVRRRRKLREDTARHIFRQIVTGIRYCHSKQVIHRDIKLDNILLTSQGTVKICDFGVSKQLKRPNEKMFEQCGTPAYMAPEVFENKGYEGYQSDVWSAGVVLFAMLYGTVPFKASNINDLHKQVLNCKPDFVVGEEEGPSLQAVQLMKGILERDTSKRLTCDQILSHPWMTSQKCKVNVFSASEKAQIIEEFEHYNQRKERQLTDLDGRSNQNADPFAEHLLQSTQNSVLKNATSKSQILAPFNSTLDDASEISMNKQMMLKMMAPRRTIKFAPKVAEIDRQYEQNNNAQLDNGVYHQDEEKDGGLCNDTKQSLKSNGGGVPTSFHNQEQVLATSFGKHELESQLQELASNSAESESQRIELFDAEQQELVSEWKQLENQLNLNDKMIQQITQVPDTDEESSRRDSKLTTKQQPQSRKSSLLIQNSQQSYISIIESFGYPEEYIIESLKQAEFNHVTAFYSLLTSKFEY